MSELTDLLRKVSNYTGKPFFAVKTSYYLMPREEREKWVKDIKEVMGQHGDDIDREIEERMLQREKDRLLGRNRK